MNPKNITIVGSGLAGTLMTCYLGRAGYAVDLYEKRPDPRKDCPYSGRSINLALSLRGIHALEEAGVASEVLKTTIAMPGRMIHAPDGSLHFQPYGKDPSKAIHAVSRAGLNIALIDAAEKMPNVRLFFAQRCTGIDLCTTTLHMVDDSANRPFTVPCQTVIGADGAFSAVRASMLLQERFAYSQDWLSHGYKELTIPAVNGDFAMEPHALHIWPRRRFMLIALPNSDCSFTCNLFLAYEGEANFASLATPDEVRRFFQTQFPDALALMPEVGEEFFANPTGSLVTVRCWPWHQKGRVVLIGDACHALVPFLGQGMNAAFEDCSALARCLREQPDQESAFRTYGRDRKEHTDTLGELAVENFVEMRDRTGSRLFLLRKKWEALLHKLLGEWYVPLYTLIAFTLIPHADALRRARKQARIVRVILVSVLLLALLLVWWASS